MRLNEYQSRTWLLALTLTLTLALTLTLSRAWLLCSSVSGESLRVG